MEKLNERQYPTYGSISVLNVAEMGTFDKATVSKARLCGWQNLLAMVIAIITSLFLGASLSWYFTQKSLTPSNNRISRDVTNNESPKTDMGPSAAELRLPRSLNPLSYDLTIQTYLPGYVDIPKEKNLTFDGQVTINLVTLASLRKLVFNAKNLKINETKCNLTVDGQPLGIKSVVLQPQFEKVAFDLEGDIKSGANVELKIGYTGLINSNLGGLYQAAYVSADGTPKIAAVTQMESTDARQMVPCLDEPAYKANWTVTVIHPKGTNAISNGYTLDSKAVNDNFIITTFEPTPKMSSYLLAIIVSDFQSVKASGNHKVEFRVWGTEQGKEYLTYAAEMGQKCLEFYEDYFKIPFPLKKMDMVALPDFAAGAMENWGLITYRETSLLYNPALWPPQQKRRVAVVIAHELAHQWFGNLVTMKWWDDLWLNEGFATYVEYIGTNHISDGNFRMNEYFIERALNTAFDADNQASSHPLSFKIDKAFEVAEAFDSISYEKGGSILQMIKHVMTEEKFNDGIYEYLNAHSYGNAEASDLWVALNNHSTVKGPGGTQLDIPQFASQWTVQMGYPYLTAEQYNETAVKVYQTRYKLNQAAHEKEKYANPIYKFKWDVPIWYQVGGNPTKMTWLPRDGEIFIDVGKDKMDEALILNAESRAFYRQNYDYDGWMKVIKQLKTDHTVFSNVTRYAIISDAFAMAAIEKINYTMLFDLLDYMKNESEYLPITAFINGMTEISKHFGTDPEIKFFEDYMSKMVHIDKFTDTYNSIAHNYLDDVKFFENVKELKIFEFNCDHGSVECNSLLKEKYNQELKTTCKNNELLSKCVKIAAPLRKDVYCAGVKNGDQGEFERMMNYYKRETVQLEQSNILQALACSQDPVTLKSLISTTIDRTSNVIRFQDASSVFQYIAKNNIGSEFIFKSFIQRWEDIYKSFKSDIGIVGKIISSCVGSIRTSQELNQLIQFRDTAPHASEFNAFTKNIEKIQNTIEWINKNYKTVTKLLQERI